MTDLSGRYGCVSTGTSIADLAIDRFQGSVFNHAFIVTDAVGGIIEATPHRVRHGNLSEYAGHPVMLNTGETVTADQLAAVVRCATSYLGDAYAWTDIVRLGLAKIGLRSSLLDRHVDKDPHVICSELVSRCGQAAELDWLCGTRTPADVTPGLLAARPGMEPYTA